MENNYCAIMAGGIGSRFWPISKSSRPKQFLDILGTGKTLLQLTFERFAKICPEKNILIVTNAEYKSIVLEQLPGIDPNQVLCEPSRRNTAPCVAYAAHKIAQINPNARLVVAPSDHLILNESEFIRVVSTALEASSQENVLLTLGIQPSRPDTGYGYIQATEEEFPGNSELKKVKTFTEKPDLELAKVFLESGDFSWNSGIFIWSIPSILEAMAKDIPEINDIFKEGADKYNTPEEEAFIEDAYSVCTNISIDYGIMEKANNVFVFPCEFGWTDLGTWGSVYEELPKDEKGNAATSKKVMLYNSSNCMVSTPKNKLIVIEGLDDYIVVEDEKALLICPKKEEQKIKQFVTDVSSNPKLKDYV